LLIQNPQFSAKSMYLVDASAKNHNHALTKFYMKSINKSRNYSPQGMYLVRFSDS
jgi:hypothetical protein